MNTKVKEAQYECIEKVDGFEVRRYPAQIVAETVVDADFEEAANVAFPRLYNYISGDNRRRQSIPITAPVNQQASSEKIPMTAPVSQQPAEGRYVVSFLMPSKYTLDSMPEPLDPQVRLRQIPPQRMAVIRYSGSWTRKRFERRKSLLEDFVNRRGLAITGEAVFARYNPPLTPAFLRRNEVLFPVE